MAVALYARGQDGYETNPCGTGSEGVVNIVSHIKRHRGWTITEDLKQAVGMGLFTGHVVHADDGAKVAGAGPLIESEGKFLARTAGEKVQLEVLGPALDLPGSDKNFFAADISGAAVGIPIKSLESVASLLIRGRLSEGGSPAGNHGPVVIVSGLILPAVKLRPGDALSCEEMDGVESRAPEALANVDKDPINVENEDLGNRCEGFASGRCGQGRSQSASKVSLWREPKVKPRVACRRRVRSGNTQPGRRNEETLIITLYLGWENDL